MEIFLPIAGKSINILLVVGLAGIIVARVMEAYGL